MSPQEERACALGREAYASGVMCAPALDPRFVAMLGEVGANMALSKAWQRGWILASLADA